MTLFARRGSTTVSLSDLAQEAGLARGTIYNNIESLDRLFFEICSEMTTEMNEEVVSNNREIDNPVERLARGIATYLKRTQEDPAWGRFVVTFALSEQNVRDMFSAAPVQDLMAGLEGGFYRFRPDQVPSAMAVVAGTTLCSMLMILEGMKTWKDASFDGLQMILCGLGLPKDEAVRLARIEL